MDQRLLEAKWNRYKYITAYSTLHASTSATKRNSFETDMAHNTRSWTQKSKTFTKVHNLLSTKDQNSYT